MSVPHEGSRSKKRQRDTLESISKASPGEPPSPKRRKHISEAETYRWHRPPGFWDRLSKVHLTRGALREFDRRTSTLERQESTSCSSINAASGPAPKSVKQFSRRGGPGLSHLRGFALLPDQNDSMSQTNSSRKRPSTSGDNDTPRKSKSSYDRNFGQNLMDAGIYPHNKASKPGNAQDIRDHIARNRASLSPSRFRDEDFEAFQEVCDRTGDEATVMSDVMSIIAGSTRQTHYHASDRLFNHLEPFTEELPKPKPDLYDGAVPQTIDRRVRRDLGKHIVPCNNNSLPAAPNFFMEGKGEEGRADVAKRQVCHDGAVGARAMHSLQNYRSADVQYDGHAYSYSSTYHQGTATLQLYAHHLTPPKAPGECPEYHMTQLDGYQMTSNRETFIRGATGYRNCRDRAKTDRDNFIDRANQIARLEPADTQSTTLTNSRTSLSAVQEDESATSSDQLDTEQAPAKRTRHPS